MPTIAQAIQANTDRIATQQNPPPQTASLTPIAIAPTPPQDLPVGLGLPQRGMFSTSVASVADRNDNARVFRGQGVRSATFPGNQTQSNVTTKVTTTNVSVTPSTPSGNGVINIVNDTNITGSITGQTLTLGWSGQLSIARGGTGTSTPGLVAGTNVTITGTWPNQTIAATGGGGGGVTSVFGRTGVVVSAVGDYNFSQISGTINVSQEPSTTVNAITNDTNVTGVITAQNLALGWTGTLAVARGGTGTASPALVPGTNITISGTWPNQTINATGGAGVTVTGSPSSGNLTIFSSGATITNSDLTGDITTSGTVATTLATVNATTGSFTNANITVNAKGLITAAANGSGGSGASNVFGANINYVVDNSSSAFATKGIVVTAVQAITVYSLYANVTGTNGNVYQAAIINMSSATAISSVLATSATYTFSSSLTGVIDFKFASPPTLTAGNIYFLAIEITSGSGTTVCNVDTTTTGTQVWACPGFTNTASFARIATNAPSTGTVLTGAGIYLIGVVASL